MTDEEAYEKIISLKKKYPEGRGGPTPTPSAGISPTNTATASEAAAWAAYIVQDKLYGPDASYEMYDSLDWGRAPGGRPYPDV